MPVSCDSGYALAKKFHASDPPSPHCTLPGGEMLEEHRWIGGSYPLPSTLRSVTGGLSPSFLAATAAQLDYLSADPVEFKAIVAFEIVQPCGSVTFEPTDRLFRICCDSDRTRRAESF
jgi:hypothetical protein